MSVKEFPAVLLNGARQAGKSTLAEQLLAEGIVRTCVSLDEIEHLEMARSNPDGFIAQFELPLAIDEIQRAPGLMRALKKAIDSAKTPGRFLLTGSANVLSHPDVTESLAGRMDIISLDGLSLAEQWEQSLSSIFLEDLLSAQNTVDLSKKWNKYLAKKPSLDRKQLLEHIFYGGYPRVWTERTERFRGHWFSSYQTAYIERDVRDLSRLLDITAFAKLYKLIGLNSSKQLNLKELGCDAKLDHRTVMRYLEILEMTFQVTTLQPWHRTQGKSLVKKPKLYINDSGQACYLSGVNQLQSLAEHPSLGALFETWVFSELRKLLAHTYGVDIYFYRTSSGHEVDFVLSQGRMLRGIECKWTDHIQSKDFKALKNWVESAPKDALGVLLYTGDVIVPISDQVIGVPVRMFL